MKALKIRQMVKVKCGKYRTINVRYLPKRTVRIPVVAVALVAVGIFTAIALLGVIMVHGQQPGQGLGRSSAALVVMERAVVETPAPAPEPMSVQGFAPVAETEAEPETESKTEDETETEAPEAEVELETEVVTEAEPETTTPWREYQEWELNLLADVMYAEEGFIEETLTNFEETERAELAKRAHLLAGSCLLNRLAAHEGGYDMWTIVFTGYGYAQSTRDRILSGELNTPDEVREWAKELFEKGPIGPAGLIYQAEFQQGDVYEVIGNQYFGIEPNLVP